MSMRLWDEPRLHESDSRMVVTRARARTTDGITAHAAARKADESRSELVYAIKWWLSKQPGPRSAFDIADALCGKWQHDSVRTRVSGMHGDGLLTHVDNEGVHGGRSVRRYVLADPS